MSVQFKANRLGKRYLNDAYSKLIPVIQKEIIEESSNCKQPSSSYFETESKRGIS